MKTGSTTFGPDRCPIPPHMRQPTAEQTMIETGCLNGCTVEYDPTEPINKWRASYYVSDHRKGGWPIPVTRRGRSMGEVLGNGTVTAGRR